MAKSKISTVLKNKEAIKCTGREGNLWVKHFTLKYHGTDGKSSTSVD